MSLSVRTSLLALFSVHITIAGCARSGSGDLGADGLGTDPESQVDPQVAKDAAAALAAAEANTESIEVLRTAVDDVGAVESRVTVAEAGLTELVGDVEGLNTRLTSLEEDWPPTDDRVVIDDAAAAGFPAGVATTAEEGFRYVNNRLDIQSGRIDTTVTQLSGLATQLGVLDDAVSSLSNPTTVGPVAAAVVSVDPANLSSTGYENTQVALESLYDRSGTNAAAITQLETDITNGLGDVETSLTALTTSLGTLETTLGERIDGVEVDVTGVQDNLTALISAQSAAAGVSFDNEQVTPFDIAIGNGNVQGAIEDLYAYAVNLRATLDTIVVGDGVVTSAEQVTYNGTANGTNVRQALDSLQALVEDIRVITQDGEYVTDGQTFEQAVLTLDQALFDLAALVDTLNDAVTALNARMNTAEANITDLQGRVEAIEGDYATQTALTALATTLNNLGDVYVTDAELASALGGYVTTATLADYVSDAELAQALATALADIVTADQLADYVTADALATALVDYVSDAELASYVSEAELTAQLASYVSSTALAETLADYATAQQLTDVNSNLSAAISDVDTDLSQQLADLRSIDDDAAFAADLDARIAAICDARIQALLDNPGRIVGLTTVENSLQSLPVMDEQCATTFAGSHFCTSAEVAEHTAAGRYPATVVNQVTWARDRADNCNNYNYNSGHQFRGSTITVRATSTAAEIETNLPCTETDLVILCCD